MSNPSDPPRSPAETAALAKLRAGVNPFGNQVAAVGTAEDSILAGVPAFAHEQLSALLEIIGNYRSGPTTTQVYPLLGDRGTGKTHLLYTLRDEIRRQAADKGEETLLVVVERLSTGMDAIDYLLWSIVNFLLAQKGEGGRMLSVITGRLTGRLLAESLRLLAPHQRAELIPAAGFWKKLTTGADAKGKLAAIDELIQRADSKNPTPEALRDACAQARVKPETALELIEQHLDRTESKDVLGWFRKQLYGKLARVALLQDRTGFEELHAGDFEDAAANVKNAGNLSRRLLDTWLELLTALNIPVIVVFDQLEDYLRHHKPEQEKINRQFFTSSASLFVNELRSVCVLVFSEDGLWTQLMNDTEAFTRERLTQPIALKGREAKPYLQMPDRLTADVVQQIVRKRLLKQFPDLDLTGLPASFPFREKDIEKTAKETSIRLGLRELAKRYNEIVFAKEVVQPKIDWKQRLADLWNEKIELASREELSFKGSFIPEVQNALDGWLQALFTNGLTGAAPWFGVEIVSDPTKGQYGYLNVIRTEGPDAPGIGIAAWFGQNRGQPVDLKQRIEFFQMNPCPIKTLVMLREDAKLALQGATTKAVYQQAVKAKRDVRFFEFAPRHIHCLLAFSPWHQVATSEVEMARETDPKADSDYKKFLGELSKELLGWINGWRNPPPPEASE